MAIRVDPYRSFNFLVEIDGITQAGFQECSGLDSQTASIDFRLGDDPMHVRKLTGLNTFSAISSNAVARRIVPSRCRVPSAST